MAKRLWALDAPTITVDQSLMMVGGSGVVTIPMPAFLIEHPAGLVLFDTGPAFDAADDPESVYGPLAEMFDMRFPAAVRVDRQLGDLGYKTSDVRYVVASHLHFDHAGGRSLVPDATFLVGPGEMRYAYWPDKAGAAFFRREDFEPTREFNWLELPGGEHDVFGDGALVVFCTPGHTPGELSMLVRLPERNFLLVGDTVHLRVALEGEIPNMFDANTQVAAESIRRLKLIRAAADATVWISHDPEDWAEFGHAPQCFE
ncbi:MAG: N-acyl homoserine lactonase family protein [Acidimicrobiia bacterium]